MDATARLEARLERLEHIVRGNGAAGLSERVRATEAKVSTLETTLEGVRRDLKEIKEEREAAKAEWRGVKRTLIGVGAIIGVGGGGFGVVILRTLSEITSALP